MERHVPYAFFRGHSVRVRWIVAHVFRARLISFAVPGYPWGKPLQAWRAVECQLAGGWRFGDMARHVTTVWGGAGCMCTQGWDGQNYSC